MSDGVLADAIRQAMRSAPDFTEAACVGRWQTYDDVRPHEGLASVEARWSEARRLCGSCPVLTECRAWLRTTAVRPSGVVAGLEPPLPPHLADQRQDQAWAQARPRPPARRRPPPTAPAPDEPTPDTKWRERQRTERDESIRRRRAAGESVIEIAKTLHCSTTTVRAALSDKSGKGD